MEDKVVKNLYKLCKCGSKYEIEKINLDRTTSLRIKCTKCGNLFTINGKETLKHILGEDK